MDLIWGHGGILLLGHDLFFALGGYAFRYFAFRSRIKGVYFSIITQALTLAFLFARALAASKFNRAHRHPRHRIAGQVHRPRSPGVQALRVNRLGRAVRHRRSAIENTPS
jgi:hypothetical protein